ncbi:MULTISPECIES: 1-acyl-sn-glycerol-3-phosphate acyltransferase [Flectobacillus]|jgi:1-acyl-sn-glycerol-3-phosphate acyltransferase|uniref:lysophospholipid acyltransferase family protein n=1 Tax=Flectobacillus TaxID=101 RepID=UPI000BA32595|nr:MULTISPECIES: lysophospholipid acyltransferase family protein [Flectobacillus]MDI9868515.1 lysophospholipid acyltransferase family protein [Flectobacillus roseus]PAC30530.1 1-acyl-sn-glycerol-3-phosphate acyltransferase [Flectobacillus sp. BAB-3569]
MKLHIRNFLSMFDVFGIVERDPFGNSMFLKRIIMFTLGWITYGRLRVYNKTKISGTEHLENLPQTGVLFLSNHQTYFMDVICLYHVFFSIKWGFKNSINFPIYLLAPRSRLFYVAASETMKEGGLLPRIFSQAGAILVNRSWRAKGHDVKRELDTAANDKVGLGLKYGWVVSFPQGTTTPYAPLRKGTAHLIKAHNPIVVPVVINGFRRAFDKKGLLFKKRNTTLSVTFKEPIQFDPNMPVEEMMDILREQIEQKIPVEKLKWRREE